MSLIPQRAAPRWKEWIPLFTQQQRLRNLIQVMAYNVPWKPNSSMYYTLHLTTMSPPFYTSESLHHQHPRWNEMDFVLLEPAVNTSATGVVIRLWLHEKEHSQDQVLLVWGVLFSGLVYLGPRLTANSTHFNENTVVLHLQGGYFTSHSCIKEPLPSSLVRNIFVTLPTSHVKPSYTVPLLLRLRTVQQAIKKQTHQSNLLRDKIVTVGFSGVVDSVVTRESSVTLRKLLSKGRPKPQQRTELLAMNCQIELVKFRISLLQREKQRKNVILDNLETRKESTANEIADRSCLLTERYRLLQKEVDQLKENSRLFVDMRETYLLRNGQLSFRRKQLLSQLNLIYPISKHPDGKYTICGIHLPNSEDLASTDDITLSVALGFVAHVVEMISIFLQVPLRYPIIHCGSRSKITDHISTEISDKERQFPLFSRGKEKTQFHYGVYLLNKNIAQLRWLVGLNTTDLRTTLHNLYYLLHLSHYTPLDAQHRSMSGSSLEVIGSSTNASPVGSHASGVLISPGHARMRHPSSSDLIYLDRKVESNSMGHSLSPRSPGIEGMANSSTLSYSLDKGLDEYEEIKKTQDVGNASSANTRRTSSSAVFPGVSSLPSFSHMGSEPNLASHLSNSPQAPSPSSDCSMATEGPSSQVDDNNEEVEGLIENGQQQLQEYIDPLPPDKSEFSTLTGRLVELVDSIKDCDTDSCKNSEIVSSNQADVMSSFHADNVMSSNQADIVSSNQADIVSSNQVDSATKKTSLLDRPFNSSIRDSRKDSISNDEVTCGEEAFVEQTSSLADEFRRQRLCSGGDIDLATDALAGVQDEESTKSDSRYDSSGNNFTCSSDENGMECIGIEENVLEDNLFANVASRTEALASRTTSFNLMSSRYGGAL